MTVFRIRFEGPAAITVRIATALADADGVELISSERPSILDKNTVELRVAVAGALDSVADALASIRDDMPTGASIAFVDD